MQRLCLSHDPTPRPSDSCSLAFYFPVNGVAPEVIWFENGQQHKKDEVTGVVIASDLFGDDTPELSSVEVNLSYGKISGDLVLEVQARKDSKSKKAPLNMTIVHTTQGQQRNLWASPIVVCALYDGTPGLRRNVTIQDFSALVTCLRTPATINSQKHCVLENYEKSKSTTLRCSQLSCINDRKGQLRESKSPSPATARNLSPLIFLMHIPFFTEHNQRRCLLTWASHFSYEGFLSLL